MLGRGQLWICSVFPGRPVGPLECWTNEGSKCRIVV